MENKNITPDYFELENKRSKLIENTLNTSSGILKVFHFYRYFSIILEYRDQKTEEAFLKEFIDDYFSALSGFEVWGMDLHFTDKLISQLNDLKELEILSGNTLVLGGIISRIEEQRGKLLSILEGKTDGQSNEQRAYFPLIDSESKNGFYGIIDSVTIRISRASQANKFIIIPSEREIEKRIIDQCRVSWDLSVRILRHYVKKQFKYHEVIINFEKKEGYYEGDSLGIALTISFLDQLLKFYNPVYSINIAQNIAFTGSVTEKGETASIGNQIIKQKVAAVFFSDIKTFVFPKSEESSATKELNELKIKYPNRVLKLIPAEDIADILNRRDIVEIKKRNIIIRTGKFVRKNWISAAVILLLILLFSYEFLLDFDDNPSSLVADGETLYIKNQNGKILGTKMFILHTGKPLIEQDILRFARIIDINSDGQNEIIMTNEINEKTGYPVDRSSIKCFDKSNKLIWRFSFSDKVYSKREELNTEYGLSILDTLTYSGQKSLFLISSNGPSFSSAIYRIDLMTGKRLPGTFWSAGHVIDCCIKDIDGDNKPEMVGAGYENGYEDLVFFAYEIDTLIKVRPTTEEYLIQGFPQAEMKAYIRFPKTDFDNYKKGRTPGYSFGSFFVDDKDRKFQFGSEIPFQSANPEIGYEINYNLKDINVVILSSFRVQRDTLVAHGILKQPYTDTEEYKNIIKSKILYWKDGKWVKRNELD